MNDDGVMKTEDNSLLVVLKFGVEKLPAIEDSEKCSQGRGERGREGEGKLV